MNSNSTEDAELSITKEVEGEELMYAIVTYAAETDDSVNLVEGEKVYVIGKMTSLGLLNDRN